jgi:prephenate dehydrogenase
MLGRVTIIGCGLIGGSLMKRLREKKSATRVSVVDSEAVLAAARPYIDEGATPGSPSKVAMVADSDLVILATPVSCIVRDLEWALDAVGPDAVVTDTGSVKQSIVGLAARHERGSRFVGGHPMAGREVGGFDASSADLFEGARWFIVPPPVALGASAEAGATVRFTHSDALARVVELVGAVGAEPIFVESEAHDRAMAYVSHAPQVVASAILGAAARAGALADAGPGFRDVTRIAGGPEAMWRDIFASNRRNIAQVLGELLEPLIQVRDALLGDDEAGVLAALELLGQAQIARSTMTSLERRSRGSL